MDKNTDLTFVDLYCGAGFGGRGAVNAGATPLFAVDAWDIAAKTYKHNFPSAEVITGNVEDRAVRKRAEGLTVDVLLTSPECTSHSIARGAKKGCEKSRETAINILPWVKTVSPRWIIVENVSRMKQWERHSELRAAIKGMGYAVSEMELNAADYGAPQARKRLFLICDRGGTTLLKDDFEEYKVSKVRSAADVIEWDVDWPTTQLFKNNRAENTLARAKRAIDTLGVGKPFIIVYYGSDYAGGWQSLEVPLRTITTIDRFGLVTYKDGESRLRMLQPSELQKAMGAASHLLHYGNRREKVKLCGNGVCSTIMEVIFRKISEVNRVSEVDAVI